MAKSRIKARISRKSNIFLVKQKSRSAPANLASSFATHRLTQKKESKMEERGIIATIIIGFLAGLIARFLKPGDDKSGLIMTTILGIVGAFVGSFLGQAFGIYGPNERAGFIGAVVGAIIVLAIVGAFNKKKALP